MANNELIRNKAERSIKNSAGRLGLNRLNTKNYRLTTKGKKFSTKINLFMQNKANFPKSQMNVNTVIATNYEQRTMNYGKKQSQTKPIQSQFAGCSK
jgi:hypothetical protein